MSEMSSGIAIIATVILAIILWGFYHKIVHKVYLGNMMQAIIGEILVSLIVSFFIVITAQVLLGWLFNGILSFSVVVIKLVWSLIKIAIIVGGIGGVIFIIYKAISTKGKSVSNKPTEAKNNNSNMTTDLKESHINKSCICQECGTSNDSESIFCENCGSKLQKNQQEDIQKNIEVKAEEDTVEEVRCSQCGNLLNNEDKFCGVCGAALK